jgi:hypothetical protein
MARDVMLYEFMDQNRDMIISGTRDRVRCSRSHLSCPES